MLYTKNKDSVKKSIAKVQHKGAHKHIINMVKQIMGRQNLPNQSSLPQFNQNREINGEQKQQAQKQKMNSFVKQSPKQPIICESIYSSVQRHERKGVLTIQNVIDYSIRNIGQTSKSSKAQKQYIGLLQDKNKALELQIAKYKEDQENRKKVPEKQQPDEKNLEFQKLLGFYHKARNILVLQSVQLLQSKTIISQLKPSEPRLKSINCMMAKTQQLLQVYRRSMQKGSPRKPSPQSAQCFQREQLKQLCEYQQKTIEFLRKQASPSNQFNQIRLLRYQINRVCSQNQNLLQKLSKKQKSPIKDKSSDNQQIGFIRLKQLEQQNQRLRSQVNSLKVKIGQLNLQIKQEIEKSYKLREQKQCLIQFLDEAKSRTDQLQKNMQKYEKQICELKVSNVKSVGQLHLIDKDIATTQELCRELQKYPRYFKLLMSIINQYEVKVSELQDKICGQRQQKQKFMQWSSQVYHLLSSAQLPKQIIQKHMDQLYQLDHKMDNSKIQKFLRQIRALSIGIDEKQIKQMEIQLEDYIISLKCRNQVIKEVECQDGSSVAVSDTFTDQEFD